MNFPRSVNHSEDPMNRLSVSGVLYHARAIDWRRCGKKVVWAWPSANRVTSVVVLRPLSLIILAEIIQISCTVGKLVWRRPIKKWPAPSVIKKGDICPVKHTLCFLTINPPDAAINRFAITKAFKAPFQSTGPQQNWQNHAVLQQMQRTCGNLCSSN